jgi:nickel-type superoxide dismutase maturation protease
MPSPLRVATVHGASMVPALRHGDRVLVWLRPPRRPPSLGSIVVVELPDRPLSIKRLVGVEPDGRVRIEGDNEVASTDSRALGALPTTAVRGVAMLRLWPRPGRLPSRRV